MFRCTLSSFAGHALLVISMALAPIQVRASLQPEDYHHTRWTADNGAPPAIRAMAQTADGWLWLGTLDGLYRFDGVHFTRFDFPRNLALNRNLIDYLHAGPSGELYIGHLGEGISVLQPDGRLQRLPPGPVPGEQISALTVDVDGSIWVVSQGIYHLREGRWKLVEEGAAWTARDVRSLGLDQLGALWATRNGSAWRLDRKTGHFQRILDVGGDLLPAPDGRLWLLSDTGELRLLADADGRPPAARLFTEEAAVTGQFAPDGSLWVLNCASRPCILPDAARHAGVNVRKLLGIDVTSAVRMSGQKPYKVLVDREGSTWISTEGGLDRFRRNRIGFTALRGAGVAYSLATDVEGRVWAANAELEKMWQLFPDKAVAVKTRHPVSVISRDPAGTVLMGGKRSIWRDSRSGLQEVQLPPGPDGKPMDMRMVGVMDDGKVLWTVTYETDLIGWRSGKWHAHTDFKLPSKIYQSARAGAGQLWLATGDGELFHYDVERNATRPAINIRALGMTAAIFPGPELLLSGDNGAGVVHGNILSMLRAADPNVLRNVSGLVVTADGDRWLNGAAGLVHIHAADWKRSVDSPMLPVRYEVFDSLDGYPGRAVVENRWPTALSADGHTLWLVATGGVIRVDTANLVRNQIPPVPAIMSLATETTIFRTDASAHASIHLAPGTERFRIDFTSPSLRMPERVSFEYMLEGVDNKWQEAGVRRTTSYTSVRPGSYVFRLRATNEDGVRSMVEATLPINVEPTIWQTTWAKLIVGLALAFLLVLAYRYRVLYLTRRVADRMGVKIAERERIARTLHDTFLQTVQSLQLRVDSIASSLPKGDRAREELESALHHASSALGEGREQLQDLRSGSDGELKDLLGDIVSRLQAANASIIIRMRVDGRQRCLTEDVSSEAAAIASEALRNACIHGAADQVRATLDYGDDSLTLTVSDNGCGIDPSVMRNGAANGRWGLVGMRERAQRIAADLEIAEGSEGGTVVRLVVPGMRAYHD